MRAALARRVEDERHLGAFEAEPVGLFGGQGGPPSLGLQVGHGRLQGVVHELSTHVSADVRERARRWGHPSSTGAESHDRIDHARLGWAYLGTAPAPLRRAISEWLVPLTACNLREWRRIDLPEDDALAVHGVPPRELALAALDEAVTELLVLARDPVGEWILLDAETWLGPDGSGVAFARLGDTQGYFGRAIQSVLIEKR